MSTLTEQWSLYLPRVCFWAPSRPDDKRSFPAASETGTLVSIASALDAFPCFLEISPTDCRCNLTLAWSYYCIRYPPLQFWESYVNISMHFIYKYLLFIVCNCSFTVYKYYPCHFFENQMLLPKYIMFTRLEFCFRWEMIFCDLTSRLFPLFTHVL